MYPLILKLGTEKNELILLLSTFGAIGMQAAACRRFIQMDRRHEYAASAGRSGRNHCRNSFLLCLLFCFRKDPQEQRVLIQFYKPAKRAGTTRNDILVRYRLFFCAQQVLTPFRSGRCVVILRLHPVPDHREPATCIRSAPYS